MKFEWIERLEESLPILVGFGRLVNFKNPYWHTVRETQADGQALLKLAGETVKVAGMYGMNAQRIKFAARRSTVFILTLEKSSICGLLPTTELQNEELIWQSLQEALELMMATIEIPT